MTAKLKGLTPRQRIMLARCANRSGFKAASGGELATLRALAARSLVQESRSTGRWHLTADGRGVLRRILQKATVQQGSDSSHAGASFPQGAE